MGLRVERSAVAVCAPAFRVFKWPCGAMLGRRQGDKYGAEQGQQAGGLGVIWVAQLVFVQGLSTCLSLACPACQGHGEERPGGYKETELGQSGSLVMFT